MKWLKQRRMEHIFNICIETPIYEKLEALCADAGQTKTKAVERALKAYFDDYERTQQRLKAIDMESQE